MATRDIVLATGEFYHVFNRGVAGMKLFNSHKNYIRFIELINYYRFHNTLVCYSSFRRMDSIRKELLVQRIKDQNKIQVSIHTFCLMPNHFHFLLRQESEGGITRFMRCIQDGYAKYFNTSLNRYGPLYQSSFKAVRIENEEQFLHSSRYMHLNPSTSYLIAENKLLEYPWSSFQDFVSGQTQLYPFVDTKSILSYFVDKKAYENFVLDQVAYQRELHKIKHLLLE
jgi:putative transposase